MTQGRAGTMLDRTMPTWSWSEYHSIEMPGECAGVIDAADALTWGEVPLFRRIMRTVSLGRVPEHPDGRVLELFTQGPYVQVHRDAEELVYVGFLQARPDATVAEFEDDPVASFRDASPPRSVKVAMNFLYRDGVLSTETRCQATERFATRAFSLYWLAIRSGSGAIRGSWLRGIRRKTQNGDEA